MINSLKDVERYSRELAKAVPLIADHTELRSPGLNDLEMARLHKAVPGLTEDYLQIARSWRLDPVSIGYFSLRPPSFGSGRTLVESLIGANGELNPNSDRLKEFRLLEVASYEGDPLTIGARQTPRAGQVFRFALSEDSNPRPRLVASRFEDLLKAATELDASRAAGRVGSDAIQEFLKIINTYVPNTALEEWKQFAEIALQLP